MIIQIIYILLIIAVAFAFPTLYLRKGEKRYLQQLYWLIGYHFIFGVAFYFFTRDGGGDAWAYWTVSKNMSFDDFKYFIFQSEGTHFMEAFNYFFANWMQMGFLANTLIYTMVGAFGMVFFFLIAIREIPYNYKFKGFFIFPAIFFLPNLHFWSSGLGKDSLLFLCIAMFAYSMQSPVKRIPMVVISVLLSYAVRPHITLFMLLAFGTSFVFSRKIPISRRVFFSILLIGASFAILPQVLEFIKVDNFTTEALNERAELQASNLSTTSGSAIDISSYPFPLKIVTFLYRPLFFDAHNFGSYLSSFDNMLLLILTFLVFRYKPWQTLKKAPFLVKAFLIFGIIGTIAFAPSLGNLGIIVRQKNMFTSGILIYFLWAFSCQTESKYNNMLNFLKSEDIYPPSDNEMTIK